MYSIHVFVHYGICVMNLAYLLQRKFLNSSVQYRGVFKLQRIYYLKSSMCISVRYALR